MNFAVSLLGIIATILWLFPSSERMGIPSALGLLLFVFWLRRASIPHRARVVIVVFGLFLISAPGTSHAGIDQALKVTAGLLLFLPIGRDSLLILVAATLAGGAAQSAGVFLAMSAGAAAWRGRIRLRTEWLCLVSVVSLLIHLVVWGILANESFARWNPSATSRWKAAELLNGSDQRVLLRAVWEALHAESDDASQKAQDYLSEVERRTGRTDATWALRILCEDTKGRFSAARAFFAEAASRSRGVLDSLSVWDFEPPRWLPWALFVHDQSAYRDQVPGANIDASCLDRTVAEYLSRALAGVGLEAEACTLGTEQRWRTDGWSRYLVWQSTAAAMPTTTGQVVGRGSILLPPGGRYALMRAQPARGVWPRISYHALSQTGQFSLESEFWSLVDLGTSESCSLSLLNDLRSPFEDRNFVVGARLDLEASPVEGPAANVVSFLQRIWRRFASWKEDAPVGLDFVRNDSARVIAPAEWHEAYRQAAGWLLPAQSWVLWRNVSRGLHEIVLRGEPALGLWPIAEVVIDDTVERRVVDSWDWAEYLIETRAESADVLVRLANDYWDPSSGEDRNLWCWGLIPHSSDREGRNQ